MSDRTTPMANMLGEWAWGQSLGRVSKFLAAKYRLALALLVVALLLTHFSLVRSSLALTILLVGYLGYFVLRFFILPHLLKNYYSSLVQFVRAEFCIVSLTSLLAYLAWWGSVGDLWILYLLPLLLVSRYCKDERIYVLATLEVALALAGVHMLELRSTSLPVMQITQISISRVAALLVPCFLVHYLVLVSTTTKQGATLLQQTLLEILTQSTLGTDTLALWRSIADAFGRAARAKTEVYFIVDRKFQRVRETTDGYRLDLAMPFTELPLAQRAIDTRMLTEDSHNRSTARLAVPVYGQPDQKGEPLAVVMIDFNTSSWITAPYEIQAVRSFVTELRDYIWPICAYVDLRRQLPLYNHLTDDMVHSLNLKEVVDTIAKTLRHKLGFSFAAISLLDERRIEKLIATSGKKPEDWKPSNHMPNNVEPLPDFQPTRWKRIRVPVGKRGVIEAYSDAAESQHVFEWRNKLLNRYIQEALIAIENAQLYGSLQESMTLLKRIYAVGDKQVRQLIKIARDRNRQLNQAAQEQLTKSEREIYQLLKLRKEDDTQMTNQEIADTLGKSINTVKSQVASILRKLNLKSEGRGGIPPDDIGESWLSWR